MTRRNPLRPSAPFVINLIALLIVLGGQAIARPGPGVVKRDDFARRAVTAPNLAPRAVARRKLALHSVTTRALARAAVTGRVLRPHSVNGRSLAGGLPFPGDIPDMDPPGPMGSDGNWTASGATATCPRGTRLISGGLTIRDSAGHRAFVQSSAPSGSNPAAWVGQISSDAGGASPAVLVAFCLR